MSLRTFKESVELVSCTESFPFKHFIEAPIHGIRLRSLAGRQRDVPCFKGTTLRRTRGARVTKSAASAAPKPSSSSPSAATPLRGGGRARKFTPASKRPHRRINTFPKHVREIEPQGLYNPQNYCYRRSILQCLLHVPSFYVHVANTHKRCENDKKTCVPCALKAFFHAYWKDRTVDNFPDGPGGAVGKLDKVLNRSFDPATDRPFEEILRTSHQCDASEFLLLLVDKLQRQAPTT